MESDVEHGSPAKTEDETQGTDNPENDEPEEENASKSTRYNTQDPLNEIGNIKLEPTVEKEDSDDIPDLELFEPSVKNKREESQVNEDDDEENLESPSIAPEPAQRNLRPKPNQIQRISCFQV